ncbi:MAG: TIGR02300 family protein [Alphaproteobacteria bacterium]|nr:TIGR02300 family protein [Alphaproteobacteria bacterium]
MVKLEWGTKRTCQSCASRFYDLHRSPIICPKCGSPFEIQTQTKARRGRAAAEASKTTSVNLDEVMLVEDIELGEDLDTAIEDDAELIEDTDDLGEDLDDIPDVLGDEEVEG